MSRGVNPENTWTRTSGRLIRNEVEEQETDDSIGDAQDLADPKGDVLRPLQRLDKNLSLSLALSNTQEKTWCWSRIESSVYILYLSLHLEEHLKVENNQLLKYNVETIIGVVFVIFNSTKL